jgi:hypothetical protein
MDAAAKKKASLVAGKKKVTTFSFSCHISALICLDQALMGNVSTSC